MGRNHAPPPETDALTIAKAIGCRLHEIRDGGTPLAIIMGPDIAPVFRKAGLGGWSCGRPELFNLPVEIDDEQTIADLRKLVEDRILAPAPTPPKGVLAWIVER